MKLPTNFAMKNRTAIKYTWCYTSKTFSVLRALRHVFSFQIYLQLFWRNEV